MAEFLVVHLELLGITEDSVPFLRGETADEELTFLVGEERESILDHHPILVIGMIGSPEVLRGAVEFHLLAVIEHHHAGGLGDRSVVVDGLDALH